MTNDLDWYVLKNDQQIGPIAEATFQQFIQERIIQRTDLVWRRGLQTWIVAEQLFRFGPQEDSGLKSTALTRHESPIGQGLGPPPLPYGFAVSNPSANKPPPQVYHRALRSEPAEQTTTELDSSEGASASTKRSNSAGYVVRHWRGQLSLPVSYWFNGFLGYLISTIAVALIGASSLLRTDFSPALSLFSIIGTWMVTLAILCWQVVGTWRAATEYSKCNAKVFWAAAAKLSLCAATLVSLSQFATRGAPQIREMYNIYLGDEEVGKYAFRVLRDGAELEFSGGITFGASKEFKRFVEAMSALKIVHLNSPGGRIEEAQRIGNIIKERNLDTYVAASCLSACTIIFLSGRNRFVTRKAKIGFHQPNFAGLTDEDRIQLARNEQLRLQRFGLSAEFTKRATEAAPDQMWTPSSQELIDERVATKIVESSGFALSGIDSTEITPEKTDALLRGIPVYAAIARTDGTAYQEILSQFLDGLRRGKSGGELTTQISPIVEDLFERELPQVPPTILTEYTEMMVKHMRFLNRENSALCYVYLNPQKDDGNLLVSLGSKYPAVVQDQNDIKTKVFNSHRPGSAEEFSKDGVSESLAEVFESLKKRFGRDVSLISKREIGNREYSSYCNIMTAFYEQILRLPSTRRTGVLRTIFSESS